MRRHPDPLPAQSKIASVPWQSSLGAAGFTVFLALVGKSRPGIFLKTTAYLSAATVSISACDAYSQREMNRAVFKLDNIEPKPGKLWERTKHWSIDDYVIGGGILGTFLSLNPRALPGVRGWKRFVGAATVGCALGGYVGQTRLIRLPSQLLDIMHAADRQTRHTQYERLKQDAKAQEALSRFGKLALAFYTWPVWNLPINPFATESSSRAAGTATGAPQISFAENPHANISQQEMDQYALIQLEFNKGELIGPDIEHGYRAYKDSLADRDADALQDWLERLQEIQKKTAAEAQYVWQHLGLKEHEFYNLVADDREKDIVRREIQLLNNMASDFASRDAIFAYHIADARKRLQQIEQKESVGQNLVLKLHSMQDELPTDWMNYHRPHLVAEQVRMNWARQKELLGHLEKHATMHKDLKLEAGTPQAAQLKQIRQNFEDMKRNVEATERLLKEFEEQLRRADNYVKP